MRGGHICTTLVHTRGTHCTLKADQVCYIVHLVQSNKKLLHACLLGSKGRLPLANPIFSMSTVAVLLLPRSCGGRIAKFPEGTGPRCCLDGCGGALAAAPALVRFLEGVRLGANGSATIEPAVIPSNKSAALGRVLGRALELTCGDLTSDIEVICLGADAGSQQEGSGGSGRRASSSELSP